MTQPFFSIVIPTRNRSAELYHTLRTCLDQDFTSQHPHEYEVVVSDNCSEEDIMGVVNSFPAGSIRYERTDNPLSMADSWEFALSKARGRYVGFVCTDDGYLLNALSSVYQTIKETGARVVSFQGANYFWPNHHDPALRCKLLIPTFVFPEGLQPSSQLIQRALLTMYYGRLPCFLNSFCQADVIASIKKRHGRLFGSFCPDIYSGFIVGSHVPDVYVSNKLMFIGGFSQDSTGANFHKDPFSRQTQQHLEMHRDERLRPELISTYPFLASFIADSILKALAAGGPTDAASKFNICRYVVVCYSEALAIPSSDRRRRALHSIDAFLQKQPRGTALRARFQMRLFGLRSEAKTIINRPVLRLLQRAGHRWGMTSGRLEPECFGKEHTRIENVYDASVFVTSLLKARKRAVGQSREWKPGEANET